MCTGLEKACEDQNLYVLTLKVNQIWDSYRSDRRFGALLRRWDSSSFDLTSLQALRCDSIFRARHIGQSFGDAIGGIAKQVTNLLSYRQSEKQIAKSSCLKNGEISYTQRVSR